MLRLCAAFGAAFKEVTMGHSIYLADDEKSIRELLHSFLASDGYTVRSFESGDALLEAFHQEPAELVILDIMMPGTDGLAVCRELRSVSDIPIILLTAKSESSDKVLGLNIGADDYITKPFDPVEVLARVRSQLRRYTQLGAKKVEEQANVYTVGPIVLDEEKKSVTVDGDEVALTPIEFNILRLLMKNPGRIYSSAQIYELVWKEDSLGAETSVSVHIRHLRQKLEINPSEPRYLKVVWGLGYKMEDKK